MLGFSLTSFVGGAKKVDCNIDNQHVHVYMDTNTN